MKHSRLSLIIMLMLALAVAACGQASEDVPAPAAEPVATEEPAAEEEAEPPQQYEAVGVVVFFMAEKKFINVSHETIPGYMNAMTMAFEVKDSTLLRGIQEGDSITFRFTVADGIQAIEKME